MIKKEDCTITIYAEVDDTPLQGNVMVSGDDKADRLAEDKIKVKLNQGDTWAWASVTVTVVLERAHKCDLTFSEYLGCCSYADELAFEHGGYYDDMVQTCLQNINDDLVSEVGGTMEEDCINCATLQTKLDLLTERLAYLESRQE